MTRDESLHFGDCWFAAGLCSVDLAGGSCWMVAYLIWTAGVLISATKTWPRLVEFLKLAGCGDRNDIGSGQG